MGFIGLKPLNPNDQMNPHECQRLKKGDFHVFLGREWKVMIASDDGVYLQRGEQPELESVQLTWRQVAWQVNDHAIDRFIQRFRGNPEKRVKIAKSLIDHVLDGRAIGGGKFYAKGKVVTTYGNRILTCYKPSKPHILEAVFQAHSALPDHCPLPTDHSPQL